jgi:predicted DNA-binding transcriptional regulator AlpA
MQAEIKLQTMLSQDEVASKLGVTKSTLTQWRHKGQGPKFVKLGRRQIAYLERHLAEWIESRVFGSAVEARNSES